MTRIPAVSNCIQLLLKNVLQVKQRLPNFRAMAELSERYEEIFKQVRPAHRKHAIGHGSWVVLVLSAF